MKHKLGAVFHFLVLILECLIAILTLLVLLFLLGYEVYKMFTIGGYFESADRYLQNVLTIIVGLEFVRMLLNLTPANTLEVLIVAIARQVIIDHNNPISNLSCVICIAGLFAIRKFLISKNDLKKDMTDDDTYEHTS